MTTPDPRITAAFFAAAPEPDPEAGLGHDYDGPELWSGTPEYEALYAEYQAWAAQPASESPTVPEAGDLGLSSGRWMDLQFDYNAGLTEPQEGTVEAEAFRRMDGEVRRDYELRCESERADAEYQAWAEAHPEEAAARQAEAEAERAEPEWDCADSNAYQARVEAGLEPEAEL